MAETCEFYRVWGLFHYSPTTEKGVKQKFGGFLGKMAGKVHFHGFQPPLRSRVVGPYFCIWCLGPFCREDDVFGRGFVVDDCDWCIYYKLYSLEIDSIYVWVSLHIHNHQNLIIFFCIFFWWANILWFSVTVGQLYQC